MDFENKKQYHNFVNDISADSPSAFDYKRCVDDGPLDLCCVGNVPGCSYCGSNSFLFEGQQSIQEKVPSGADIGTATPSVSSCISVADVSRYWMSHADEQFLDGVRKDCEYRLDDVETTNRVARSLSAFVSIVTLIGFYAKLAFAGNAAFARQYNYNTVQKTNIKGVSFSIVSGKIDGASYREFVTRFMLSGGSPSSILPGVLYSLLRCGLVHGNSTQTNRVVEKIRSIRVSISHDDNGCQTIDDLERSLQAGETDITVHAPQLCASIGAAIGRMFTDAKLDDDLKSSILNMYASEPPIPVYDFI